MIIAVALVTAALTTMPARVPAPQADAACLHFGQESPAQRDRSVAALGATRAINTAQAELQREEQGLRLPPGAGRIPRWRPLQSRSRPPRSPPASS